MFTLRTDEFRGDLGHVFSLFPCDGQLILRWQSLAMVAGDGGCAVG